MFRGSHLLVLDKKGRFAVPKRYRERLLKEETPDLIMTVDPYEPCLVVYPMAEWSRVEERLNQHPGRQPGAEEEEQVKADWLSRQIVGNSEDCALDSHGRLLIASGLRRYLGFDPERQTGGQSEEVDDQSRQQVRLVGQMGKFEVWNEMTWNHRSGQQFARNKGIADRYINAGSGQSPAV